jgi:tryptophan 2,3-dioxygenase
VFKNQGPVYYGDYLKLDQFLASQEPLSRRFASEKNPEAHDEMLFIVVHQAYELWFKQILHELDSIVAFFQKAVVDDKELGVIIQRLDRIRRIQHLISGQLEIIETMTPMDFLEFRSLLIPASGFQSVQFREIEIKLGLQTHDRQSVDREFFLGRLNEADRKKLHALESAPSLLRLLEKWLERIPFTFQKDFNFWSEYQKSITQLLKEDEETIIQNTAGLSEENKKAQLENLKSTRMTFESLFDEKLHLDLVQQGQRKLSQKAILNALFVLLYRELPQLTVPYQIITALIDIDENFTAWRYRHALMAQRMLGTKIGTGGSSGHQYLKRAADNNRVFIDLFNLSTYILPRTLLPLLPQKVLSQLSFHNDTNIL